jgi:hypothetical protein
MNRRLTVRWSLLLTAMVLLLLGVIGAIFLHLVGIDALEGRNDFQFFADSNTYHDAAQGNLRHVSGIIDTVGVAGNFLGPLLVLQLVQQNYYLVMILNLIVMFVAVRSLADSASVNALKLQLLLLLNPITISSLLSVNKEVISVLFIALVVRGCKTRSVWTLAAAFAVSILVRWQLTIFLLALVGVVGPCNPLRRYRWLTSIVLAVLVSLAYVWLASILEPVQLNFEVAVAQYEGSGIFERLVRLQSQGLYWLVFPIKVAHLLFATGLRMDRLLNPTIIYNDVWQLLHSTMLLALFLLLWWSHRLRLQNDLVYISAIYVLIFGLTPIYAPRYFFPVYVLWATAVLMRTPPPEILRALGSRKLRRRSRSLDESNNQVPATA